MYGELIPLGGGDPIPLLNETEEATAGRPPRKLRHRPAVRQRLGPPLPVDDRGRLLVRPRPAEPQRHQGQRRASPGAAAVDPGDILSIAKHKYRVEYDPVELGAVGPPPADNLSQEIMSESLLARAGLDHREFERAEAAATRTTASATIRRTCKPGKSNCRTNRCESRERGAWSEE